MIWLDGELKPKKYLDWKAHQKMMSNPSEFLQRLKDFGTESEEDAGDAGAQTIPEDAISHTEKGCTRGDPEGVRGGGARAGA